MTSRPRSEVIREGEVGVYHVWSRCVRGAYLCGTDPSTGLNYSHRRDWIRSFQQRLAGLFGIEIGFRAELANHIHLVLRARPDVVETWSDEEVAFRMKTVYRLVKSEDGQTIREVTAEDVAKELADPTRAVVLRKRLSNISDFMQALGEHIAVRANREDGTSGHFWEERFGARYLESESAILVCGMYVDLNQIRAGEALTPEESTHTSAYDRIEAWKARAGGEATGARLADAWMCKLTLDERSEAYVGPASSKTSYRASDKGLLPIRFVDYVALLDATGRIIREGKRGAIPAHLAPILDRLGINRSLWIDLVTKFDSYFGHIVGRAAQVLERARQAGRRWYRGRARCAEAFG